jgi:hypothetical protein
VLGTKDLSFSVTILPTAILVYIDGWMSPEYDET